MNGKFKEVVRDIYLVVEVSGWGWVLRKDFALLDGSVVRTDIE
jgi:hypothetical protein